MTYVVWVDVLVLENFFMNLFLLYLLDRLTGSRQIWWKLGLASLAGALYVVVVFFPDLHIFYSFLMKLLVSMVMIAIAFTPYSFRRFLKLILLFYLETFIIGGCIIAVFYILNGDINAAYGSLLINSISSSYLIIGSIISIIFVKLGFDYFENYYKTENNKIKLDVYMNKRKCSITALVDTGNALKDPITNIPVIIAYVKAIADIFPDNVKKNIIEEENYESVIKDIINSSLKTRIRIIPYKTIGNDDGILYGIVVDMIVTRAKPNSMILKNPVLALYNKPISSENDYQALAYPEILK
jgi:stage II sporulation protein GA (sporulation sigma-E factor processing peptidase)